MSLISWLSFIFLHLYLPRICYYFTLSQLLGGDGRPLCSWHHDALLVMIHTFTNLSYLISKRGPRATLRNCKVCLTKVPGPGSRWGLAPTPALLTKLCFQNGNLFLLSQQKEYHSLAHTKLLLQRLARPTSAHPGSFK